MEVRACRALPTGRNRQKNGIPFPLSNPNSEKFPAEAPPPGDAPDFWELVREDLETYGGDWTRPGFQALLVYRLGVWRMRVQPKMLRGPLSALYNTLFATVRNFYGIELPFSARVGRRVVFEHQHGIVVHGAAEIGDDCIIRQGVTLGIRRLTHLADAPKLGRGVSVGAGAKILGKVEIGDHAEIGANAVVLDNVPARAIAVGIPARTVSLKGTTLQVSPNQKSSGGTGTLPR